MAIERDRLERRLKRVGVGHDQRADGVCSRLVPRALCSSPGLGCFRQADKKKREQRNSRQRGAKPAQAKCPPPAIQRHRTGIAPQGERDGRTAGRAGLFLLGIIQKVRWLAGCSSQAECLGRRLVLLRWDKGGRRRSHQRPVQRSTAALCWSRLSTRLDDERSTREAGATWRLERVRRSCHVSASMKKSRCKRDSERRNAGQPLDAAARPPPWASP
jgi:hypothetical protein